MFGSNLPYKLNVVLCYVLYALMLLVGQQEKYLGFVYAEIVGFFFASGKQGNKLKLTTLGCWSWKASVKDSDMPSHSKRVMPLPFRSHSGWEKDKVQ